MTLYTNNKAIAHRTDKQTQEHFKKVLPTQLSMVGTRPSLPSAFILNFMVLLENIPASSQEYFLLHRCLGLRVVVILLPVAILKTI